MPKEIGVFLACLIVSLLAHAGYWVYCFFQKKPTVSLNLNKSQSSPTGPVPGENQRQVMPVSEAPVTLNRPTADTQQEQPHNNERDLGSDLPGNTDFLIYQDYVSRCKRLNVEPESLMTWWARHRRPKNPSVQRPGRPVSRKDSIKQ